MNPILINNKAFYQQLEFDKIAEVISTLCVNRLAKEKLDKIYLLRDKISLDQELNDVYELMDTLQNDDQWTLPAYGDIQGIPEKLIVEGYILELEELLIIRSNLIAIETLRKFQSKSEGQKLSHLLEEVIQQPDYSVGLKLFGRLFDEYNEIRKDASAELSRLYSSVAQQERKLNSVFDNLKKKYVKSSWLEETEESMNQGRRVFSFRAEHKRKVPSLIYGYSNTGKTAFLEPQELVTINNDIAEVKREIHKEIRRLFLEICNVLRPYVVSIQSTSTILARIDLVQAKAKYGIKLDCRTIRFEDKGIINIKQGRHPILLYQSLAQNKTVVPFDLMLDDKQRTLVLSGPNAGGKSITMKAAGLIQLMAQCAIPPPVEEETVLGIFHQYFSDIGDQQSIEDELSTYSYKLTSLKYILKKANNRTLLLLDEFGSGTDPVLGGAIAESILLKLHQKGAFCVVTTHYPNLKILANKTTAMVNAAMTFNEAKLHPTYELNVGNPGSSYAFEIAQRIGLSKELIQRATKLAGSDMVRMEDLLTKIQQEREEIAEKSLALEEERRRANKLITNYNELTKSLEYNRRKLKLEAKEFEVQLRSKIHDEFEAELKEERKVNELQDKKEKEKIRLEKLREETKEIKADLFRMENIENSQDIEEGSFVKLRSTGLEGEVTHLKKERAFVQTGLMRVEVDITDLILLSKPLSRKSTKSIKVEMTKSDKIESKIDLRGMRVKEALDLLEVYLDKALLDRHPIINIVHGRGTGNLKNGVWKLLSNYPVELDFNHPQDNQGGTGATIVKFIGN